MSRYEADDCVVGSESICPWSIDQTGNNGVTTHINERVITCRTSCGSRRGDGSDPLTNDSNVSIRCNMPGTHIDELACVNDLRSRC